MFNLVNQTQCSCPQCIENILLLRQEITNPVCLLRVEWEFGCWVFDVSVHIKVVVVFSQGVKIHCIATVRPCQGVGVVNPTIIPFVGISITVIACVCIHQKEVVVGCAKVYPVENSFYGIRFVPNRIAVGSHPWHRHPFKFFVLACEIKRKRFPGNKVHNTHARMHPVGEICLIVVRVEVGVVSHRNYFRIEIPK